LGLNQEALQRKPQHKAEQDYRATREKAIPQPCSKRIVAAYRGNAGFFVFAGTFLFLAVALG